MSMDFNEEREFIIDAVTRAKVPTVHPSAANTVDIGRAVLAAYRAALPAQAEQAAAVRAAEWVSVMDLLPGKECLAVYVTPGGKQQMIRAKYVRQFQIEAEGDDCETEYNDADDTFYIKTGWLECIDNWGEYSSCYVTEGVVTHWMPLPTAPSTATSNDTGALGDAGGAK